MSRLKKTGSSRARGAAFESRRWARALVPEPRGWCRNALARGLILLAIVSSDIRAQSVRLRLDPPQVYPGEKTALWVEIEGRSSRPTRIDIPPVEGLEIEGPYGPQSHPYQANNRVTSTVSYQYVVTPTKSERGKYRIGPVSVTRHGGAALTAQPVELSVVLKPEPGIRFERTIDRPNGAVLQPFRVLYTILYSGKRADEVRSRDLLSVGRSSNFGLRSLSLPLLERKEALIFPLRVLSGVDGSSLQIGKEHRVFVQESTTQRDGGYGYRTLVFGFDVFPLRAGPLDLPPASASLELVTKFERRVRRDLFGSRAVNAPVRETFSAKSAPNRYRVDSPPDAGRPPSFNGAVGRFSVEVSAAPTEVDAFAPITVTARVRCTSPFRPDVKKALLENLSAPRWSEESSLTEQFRVSNEVRAGVVEDDVVVFTQRLRPIGDHVTQIPAIPFPYYNPDSKRYEIAKGDVIPIVVRAVETVDPTDAIRSTRTIEGSGEAPSAIAPSIAQLDGIAANFQRMGEPRGSVDPRDQLASPAFLVSVFAPPVLYAFLLVYLRRRRDPRRAERSAQGRALARALAGLGSAGGDAEIASAAYQNFFREKLQLGSGEITPGDLRRSLRERAVDDGAVERAVELLDGFLSARFAGDGREIGELSQRAGTLLREIQACLR